MYDFKVYPERLGLLWGVMLRMIVLGILGFSVMRGAFPEAWSRPMDPVKITDNVYWVGTEGLASYLVVTPVGLILIDGAGPEGAAIIRKNVEKLHYSMSQVRILLNTHAHMDHAGGLAELKMASNAKLYASPKDAVLLEKGGRGDFAWGDKLQFPAVKVDKLLKDGEVVELGGVQLKALFTPGHTKGCTTWTFATPVGGQMKQAVLSCSLSAPDYKLVGNTAYPNIVADYRASFVKMAGLPCDVFLGNHSEFFDLKGKSERMKKNAAAFVDPEGYRKYVAEARKVFEEELKKQAKRGGK